MKLNIFGTMKLTMSTLAAELRPLMWITSGGMYKMQASAANIGNTIASGDRGLLAARLGVGVGAMVSSCGAVGFPAGQYRLINNTSKVT